MFPFNLEEDEWMSWWWSFSSSYLPRVNVPECADEVEDAEEDREDDADDDDDDEEFSF